MDTRVDFMNLLPPSLIEAIMLNLDIRDVVACSSVNRTWNVKVAECRGIWYPICQKYDFVTKRSKDRTYWKRFLDKMVTRKRQMRTAECFSAAIFQDFGQQVLAFDYCEGKIAIAYINGTVDIFTEFDTEEPLLSFDVGTYPEAHPLNTLAPYDGRCILALKIDDRFLMVVTDWGRVGFWDVVSGEVFRHSYTFTSVPSSFDFLSGYNVVAFSFSRIIRIRRLFSDVDLCTYYAPVIEIKRVQLAPYPDVQKRTFWMFFMGRDTVHLSKVTFSLYADPLVTAKVTLVQEIRMPESSCLPSFPSLIFNGSHLFYSKKRCGRQPDVICMLNPDEKEEAEEWVVCANVQWVIGVGAKYIALIIGEFDHEQAFMAVDRKTEEIIAFHDIPRMVHRSLGTDNRTVLIGDTSWLDGLNGKNDRGLLFAYMDDLMRINLVSWAKREN